MTSLELFKHSEPNVSPPEPPEWGTGKVSEKAKVNLWAPKAPTWHYKGEPVKQFYTLTQLKLSNVRLNDQLLPRPQDCDMGKIMIRKPFPAEHPYASHISRFSVFPKFDTPEDAKRGCDARRQTPKNAEMPSQPYDVTIVQKVKGFGHRHEVQALPPESEKKPLHWHDGDTFDQVVKSPSEGQQPYYPTPPKVFVPNLDQRSDGKCITGNMQIGARTANAARNVERDQWQTTYDVNHTGLGPANPKSLDNLADKEVRKTVHGTGKDEDELHPRATRTFDPARPVEGRIARALIPKPPPQTDDWPASESDPAYRRKPTLTEREEDRLWNGQDYINLPETANPADNQWQKLDNSSHPSVGLSLMDQTLLRSSGPEDLPFGPTEGTQPRAENYLDGLLQQQHDQNQQTEAANRWKLLESQTPSHNLTARTRKTQLVVDKGQPGVFYGHEGKYQRERAGLYKTTYDPYSLQYSMNKDQLAGSELFYTMDSHKDALNNPLDMNEDLGELMREGRTLGGPPGSVPQLHLQPAPHEAFGPYSKLRDIQKARIQPSTVTCDVKTQENGVTLRESTYGDGFNTSRFLQENSVSARARKEPLALMSTENQDLGRVKAVAVPKTARSVQFRPSSDVIVTEGVEDTSSGLTSAPMGHPKPERAFPHPETSGGVPIRTNRGATGGSFIPLHLAAKSGNTAPSSRHSWAAGSSSYRDQFPGVNHVDMSFKNDSRFQWTPGSGTPRPQSSLVQIQDRFSKSAARRRFHDQFPETNPDLRENLIFGKKHQFAGLNAQVLRGTPVVF